MYLTKDEEKIYNGEYGESLETCINLLVSLGEIYGAERLIPITSSQVSGVSYKTIGEKGLEFLRDISSNNIKVSVPTTLNPSGMDLSNYKKLGFPEDFAKKQLEIISYFKKIGIEISCTCTPYLSGNLPVYRSHIAWAESSAVSYANSILGARTNREGGPSALAAAILGKTPYYGYHLDENRYPNYIIEVDEEILNVEDYGALGSFIGKIVKNKVPYFKFKSCNPTNKLKYLGASLAASGGVALYHVEGITPEYKNFKDYVVSEKLEVINVSMSDIVEEKEKLNDKVNDVDLICLGCPHCSLDEIKEVVDFILENNLNEKNRFKCDVWICTSIQVKAICDRMGYTDIIEKAGGNIVCDTCMVVAPIEDMGYKTVCTNSGKAAIYLPNFCNAKVVYGGTYEILKKGV